MNKEENKAEMKIAVEHVEIDEKLILEDLSENYEVSFGDGEVLIKAEGELFPIIWITIIVYINYFSLHFLKTLAEELAKKVVSRISWKKNDPQITPKANVQVEISTNRSFIKFNGNFYSEDKAIEAVKNLYTVCETWPNSIKIPFEKAPTINSWYNYKTKKWEAKIVEDENRETIFYDEKISYSNN